MLQIQKASLPTNDTFQEIVPIYETLFGKMVNARELHESLGIKKKFADWIKMYIKNYSGYDYGTSSIHPSKPQEYDYCVFEIPATQHRGRKIEYMLTLDMAKEIAMMTRSEKGHSIRKYFINVDIAFRSMLETLQNNNLQINERIAEALLISNNLLIQRDKEIKKANRNKEYNRKKNVQLRRELKELKAKVELIPENSSKIQAMLNEKTELLKQKEEKILYLEGSYEVLEDKNTRLESRLNHLLKMKLDGRSILNSFATVDVARRQKFVVGDNAKKEAKIKAYKFRKDSILSSGVIVNELPGKSFVEAIHINDLSRAIVAYTSALKKLINNEELFTELFSYQLEKANQYIENVNFENENNELEEKENIA